VILEGESIRVTYRLDDVEVILLYMKRFCYAPGEGDEACGGERDSVLSPEYPVLLGSHKLDSTSPDRIS